MPWKQNTSWNKEALLYSTCVAMFMNFHVCIKEFRSGMVISKNNNKNDYVSCEDVFTFWCLLVIMKLRRMSKKDKN